MSDERSGAAGEPTGPLHQPGAPATDANAPGDAAADRSAGGTATASMPEGRHEDAGRLGEGAEPDVWEVFRQEKDGDPMRHAGNLRAPDADLATHYAREFYSRRQESHRLWVVPRNAIRDLSDPDLLRPPLDRSFKKPGGYVMRDKLEEARRRQAGAESGEPQRPGLPTATTAPTAPAAATDPDEGADR